MVESQRRELCVGARADEVARIAVERFAKHEIETRHEAGDHDDHRRQNDEEEPTTEPEPRHPMR
jgi:hypothetical protein